MDTSIILATYCPNEARLELARRSFSEIHRTGVDRSKYELIIVSNGGLQESLFDDLDHDLLIRVDRNVGQGAGLNIGAAVSRGVNLFFVDDDLSYREGYLQVGLQLLNRHPDHVISLRRYGQKFGVPYKHHYLSDRAGGIWLMRRGLYQKIGRFSMDHYDFGGLWTRNLRRQGHSFIVSKTPYIEHLGLGHSIIGDNREFIRRYRERL